MPGPIETQIQAITADRADIIAGTGAYDKMRVEDRDLALKLQAQTVRTLVSTEIASRGRPPVRPAVVDGRSVDLIHSRDPWVDDNGFLNVRVQVKQAGVTKFIGAQSVFDEHIRFSDPAFHDDGGAENPSVALENSIVRVLKIIGVKDEGVMRHGNTTSVLSPHANDGYAYKSGTNLTWAGIRDVATATAVDKTGASTYYMTINSGLTSGRWNFLGRGFMSIDTSSIGTDIVSSATISIYGLTLTDTLGNTPAMHVRAATLASDTDLATGDYDSFGATDFSTLAWASMATSAFNDLTLNASGIASINGAGYTAFCTMLDADANNSAPSWVASKASSFLGASMNHATSAWRPYITIEHAAAGVAPILDPLVVSAFDETSIDLDQPTFDTEGDPTPTVEAFIGETGTISESGGVVSDYIEGEVDVSASGYTFSSLDPYTSYTIYVVATNSEGYSVESVEQTTDAQAPTVNALDAESGGVTRVVLAHPSVTDGVPATSSVVAYIGINGVIAIDGSGNVTGSIIGPIDVSAVGYTFQGLEPGTTYRVIVKAANSQKFHSNYVLCTTLPVPTRNGVNVVIGVL